MWRGCRRLLGTARYWVLGSTRYLKVPGTRKYSVPHIWKTLHQDDEGLFFNVDKRALHPILGRKQCRQVAIELFLVHLDGHVVEEVGCLANCWNFGNVIHFLRKDSVGADEIRPLVTPVFRFNDVRAAFWRRTFHVEIQRCQLEDLRPGNEIFRSVIGLAAVD